MPDSGPTVSAKARQIHEAAIVIDTHADTPQNFLDQGFDIAAVTRTGSIDLEKISQGNLGAEFFSIWVEPGYFGGHYARRAMDLIDSVYEQARRHPDRMVMAYSADDIMRARTGKNKKFAALLGLEGGHAIENDIHLLRAFYRLGVRYMTLTWSNTNEWADSSGDINNPKISHHDGLTPFGKQVVEEMNRLGMMVDISHVADKTFWDTIAVSKAPIIASHSSARALTQAPRNMTDDMLKAMTKNGGVVMVNFFDAFLDEDFRRAFDAQAPERDAAVKAHEEKMRAAGKPLNYADVEEDVEKEWAAKLPRPPFKVLIDHIDHIAKVAGVEHVGLGSDFDGNPAMPQGMDSAADLPKITQALLDRGYTATQIRGILGGNLLRVFRQVEQVSRELNAKTGSHE
ncbi:MAG TPA: dipeptidase [Terriglobales bacterium]|nr:dipeptidase [Terriglobales bacterium]